LSATESNRLIAKESPPRLPRAPVCRRHIAQSRGTLLRVSFSHKDIANLVGASRPRVTEHLARLEREKFVIRQGRQMVVQVAKLFDSMNAQASAHLN